MLIIENMIIADFFRKMFSLFWEMAGKRGICRKPFKSNPLYKYTHSM